MEEKLIADFFTEERKHWWHKAKRALIKQFISGSHLNVLVAGIGGGLICEELKALGHYVVGADISSASCEYANKEFNLAVIKTDLEKPLPFTEGSFDLIILADILEHLEKDNWLLSEAYRCLRPKGKIVVTVPAYRHMWSLWDIRLHHKRRYSLPMLRKIIIDSGFEIKKISYCHMLLHPFIYVYRKILGLPKGDFSNRSDFTVSSGAVINGIFGFYYCLERFLLRVVSLPFGLSVFAVGIKPC